MAYLFDTDAISEIFKPRPAKGYLLWLANLSRSQQFTVVLGELFKGAYKTPSKQRFLRLIEDRVLPQFTVLPYDTEISRIYGRLRAELERAGTPVAEADLMIAATARRFGLEVVTGNLKHFSKIPDLQIERAFADNRNPGRRDSNS
ncbi:MAG: type II toxin-antitoxin system VapC family toxin [Oligoflexia bacterium]|nr:type II toxin-antitoxin system VapC family toxin [Oligoflexia bacterium]